MRKIIHGVEFEDHDLNVGLASVDGKIKISGTNENDQTIDLTDSEINDYEVFFQTYNCISLGIYRFTKINKINISDIPNKQRIKTLAFAFYATTAPAIVLPEGGEFAELTTLYLYGALPDVFPDLVNFPNLTKLFIQCDGNIRKNWLNFEKINDLEIFFLSEPDLSFFADLPNLRRLKLVQGRMKSLNGVDKIPNLHTLTIMSPSRLSDVGAVMNAATLRNLEIAAFKKITSWDFLVKKGNFECISLDTADSIDFITQMPNVDFFFCKKVKDRNGKSIIYSKNLYQDAMAATGIPAEYQIADDRFYAPL